MAVSPTRFEFGATATTGVMFGVGWRQLPALAAGVATAGLALTRLPTNVGTLAAVVAVTAGAFVALVPVGGQRVDEWMPLWASWTRDRIAGAHRWRSPAPVRGHHRDGAPPEPAPPLVLKAVEVCGAPLSAGSRLGVATDDRAGTCAAVIQLAGDSLLLATDTQRAARFAAWGDVLAGIARAESPVARVQWLQRITPDDGTDITGWFAAHHAAAAPAAAVDSYTNLLAGQPGEGLLRHEELIVVAVSATRAGITGRRGRRDRLTGVLAGETARLASRLDAAGLPVDGVLTPELLATAVRRGVDPQSPTSFAPPGQVPPIWPLAVDATTSTLRCDGAWHASYWIEQWPAAAVPGEFLAPLIVDCRVPRTLSITAEPVDPSRARREVERDLVAAAADDELRTRLGFCVTARRRAQTATAQRREEQLAAGHSEYRVVGLITISGETKDDLEAACRQVEQLAAACHLGVRRLWGRQAEAHAATLPLARPLATSRGGA